MIIHYDNKIQVTNGSEMFEYEVSIPKYIIVNKWDRSLTPIYVRLPKPPPLHLIDNIDKRPSEQIFKRAVYPEKLKKLEESVTNSMKDNGSARKEPYSEQKRLAKIWRELLSNTRLYKDEIQWIKTQNYHIREGYWCVIDKEVCYIPGWYYFYMNFWTIDDVVEVEFRFRDRNQFVFMEYLYLTDENEFYESTGARTFFGIIYPKHRRDGATHKSLNVMYCMAAFDTFQTCNFGIQSHSGDSAIEIYREKFMTSFSKMHFFLRLMWKGNMIPEAEIKFDCPTYLMPRESSRNAILPATTTSGSYFDSKKLVFYLPDESGKCFKKDTKIRMFDGSVKNVQDVKNGDYVMGNDSTPRLVYGVTSGKEEMFEIIPNKGKGFGCNKSHILSLIDYDDNVVNIPLKEYISSGLDYEYYRVNNGSVDTCKFKVESVGEGEYFGFAVDGNHLFLLEDGTVVHNTVLDDVFERWAVLKPTLSLADGAKIIGYTIQPSTVAEMEKKGGNSYFKLLLQSDFYKRSEMGSQTTTGLATFFTSCVDGLESHIDIFGRSVIKDPSERDIWRLKDIHRDRTKKLVGARRFQMAKRLELRASGSQVDAEKLMNDLKLYPIEYLDCFGNIGGGVGFDSIALKDKTDEILRMKMDKDIPWTIGRFDWEIDGVRYTVEEFYAAGLHKVDNSTDNGKVVFVPDQNGRFKVLELPEVSNQRIKTRDGWCPSNPTQFICGIDPYRWFDKSTKGNLAKIKKSEDTKQGTSNGGFALFRERDYTLDPNGTLPKDMKTNRFVVSYRARPEIDIFLEECLMANIYYGGMCFPETNIERAYEYYIKRCFGGYLLYMIGEDGKIKAKPGMDTMGASKQDLFTELKSHIKYYCQNEYLEDIVDEWSSISNIEDMTHYDLVAATGLCLVGRRSKHNQILESVGKAKVDPNKKRGEFFEWVDYE